ncbi:MAG: NADH-quinone oxidoreductase subunit C [Bacteroidota bacterium]
MTKEELKNSIAILFPEATIEENAFVNVTVASTEILKVLVELKENVAFDFDSLVCESCVDWKTHFTMVYHLRSRKFRHELVVKATISNHEHPEIESVSHLWTTAQYHEREAYDFFGVNFLHHPDLRRLFNPDDWEGFPLRKDYMDEVNIVEL